MKIVKTSITLEELDTLAKSRFGHLIKAVVDIQLQIMVVDADLHADEEAELLAHGSKQSDLWGINIYPKLEGSEFIEFDSMINLRPSQNNLSRGVGDPQTQQKIIKVVNKLIKK